MKRRVVVTGLGAITPIGNNVQQTWNSLCQGTSGAGVIAQFDASKFKCRIACEVKGFNAADFFDRKEARKIDLFSQYGIVAAEEAIADAAFNEDQLDKSRVGVVWGTGMGGLHTYHNNMVEFARGDGTPRFSPFFVTGVIGDMCPGLISIRHGFRGPNYTSTAACASSAVALQNAMAHIVLGHSDVVVAGGSEAAVIEAAIGGFSSMQALSTRNDDPLTASRPFDRDRDGFVLGEGAAALILEEYEHAKARGAHIYAELTGVGLTADAHHITAPMPTGDGARESMRIAVESSEMSLEDVDFINTHGTSTPLGDVAEITAIQNLFGEHAKDISIDATKSMTGHLLGGAGALEALITVLAIYNGKVPPTINHFNDDPNLPALDYTFNQMRERDINFGLSNAFGFGGHNVTLAFRKMK